MNILYLTNHLNIGGITSYVLTLARGIKQKGHNVYVASSGGQLLSRFIQEDIFFIPLPIRTKSEISPKILFSKFKLSVSAKQYNIDLVHSQSRTTSVLGQLFCRNSTAIHISTCHGFFKTRLSRRMFPCWGKKVIAISESVRDHLITDFKVEPEDIRLIHNGIDIDKFKIQNSKFKIEIKKRFGLGEDPIIGIAGRLSDVKGHIYLIQAMKIILDIYPQAKLLIVGEGRMKKQLIDLTKKLKIEKNVIFIPPVHDTKDVLSIMDVFVMPSLKEGLGLSLMEAMASGVAVVASDVGGIRSLIQDGKNGLLVRPQDSEGLSQIIISLISNIQQRKYLGDNARNFIQKNFSQSKMISETEQFYQECLNLKD